MLGLMFNKHHRFHPSPPPSVVGHQKTEIVHEQERVRAGVGAQRVMRTLSTRQGLVLKSSPYSSWKQLDRLPFTPGIRPLPSVLEALQPPRISRQRPRFTERTREKGG